MSEGKRIGDKRYYYTKQSTWRGNAQYYIIIEDGVYHNSGEPYCILSWLTESQARILVTCLNETIGWDVIPPERATNDG